MRHHTQLTGLPYFGGKSKRSRQHWITGLLPWHRHTCYVEPFGGQAGILLARAPVGSEIYNDLNGDLVNWWRCVQWRRQEFVAAIEATPASREEMMRAGRVLAEPWALTDEPDLRRGQAVYAWLQNSQKSNMPPGGGTYRVVFKPKALGLWGEEKLLALANRLRQVQLENVDAVRLLDRLADRDFTVAYVDPPYAEAVSGGTDYGLTCDYDALTEVLRRQQGRIAISGYGTEWDHLEWHRHELKDTFTPIEGGAPTERTEILWCNYDARKEGSAFWDSMAIADKQG